MIRKCFALSIVVIMVSASASFAQMWKSRVEMDYGTSYNLQKYNQILNPDAGKNLEPVEGLDGEAAKSVMDNYRKGYAKKSKTPAATFAITTGGKK